MSNECLASKTRKRIENCDYEAVFTGGCCFHFALRLHERFGYTIRGIREGHDEKRLSHVWCQIEAGGKAVDIRGVYPECFLVMLATGGRKAEAHDVPVDDVRDIIRAKQYPPDCELEIVELADWIFDNHERFKAAKPLDEEVCEQCLKNIEDESNRKFSA